MSKKPPLSKLITLVCALAALDVVLAVIPLIPYSPSAAVLLKRTEGILLGSLGGGFAAFFGGFKRWPLRLDS